MRFSHYYASAAFLSCTTLLAGALAAPQVAVADDIAPANRDAVTQLEQQLEQRQQLQQQQLDDAQQKIEEQLKRIKAQEQELEQQQKQINALKAAILSTPPGNGAVAVAGRGDLVPTVSNASYLRLPRSVFLPEGRALTIPSASPGQTAQTDQSPATSAPVTQTQPETRPEVSNASIASEGGVLTPKGVFSFEPSYQYQYASNNQILIEGLTIVPGVTIGSSSVRQLVDRMHTVTLGGRLGLTDRLEVEVEVPYVYRADDTTLQPLTASGTVTQHSASGHDLGDIQFGAHYQINDGAGGWPYFVANLLVKTTTGRSPFDVPVDFNSGIPTQLPTGTGFWAVQPSVTAIYPSDPVVFFGNLKYIYNAGSTVTIQAVSPSVGGSGTTTQADIKPGDGIGGAFGMGFGINDKASFSLAYEQTYLMSTTQNGSTIAGSSYDIGDFDLGFAYQLSQRTSVNLGIQIGATKAAPDAAVILRVPIKFQLF
jgi:TolA-binding protein